MIDFESIAKSKEFNIFFRYIALMLFIAFFLSNMFLNFMSIFFLQVSSLFVNIFVDAKIIGGALHLANDSIFLIVEECIAPSAYILIFLIFLTLPISYKKLFRILIYTFILFSFFNLVRILFLMWVHMEFGLYYFEQYHLLFYKGLTGVVTGLLIIYFLRKDEVKRIYPIYSDIKYLIKKIKQ